MSVDTRPSTVPKARIGRPPLAGVTRTERAETRLTREERALVDAMHAKLGTNDATVVRELLLARAAEVVGIPTADAAEVGDSVTTLTDAA